MMLSMIDRQNK